MPALHYLTVQDILWINHRITGKVNPFRYDHLEEAAFFQYGYGPSLDLDTQAARFLANFPKKQPIAEANESTAFVAFVAFLRANGKDVEISEGDARKLIEGASSETEFRFKIVERGGHHGMPNIRQIVEGVLEDFKEALKAKTAPDRPVDRQAQPARISAV